MNSTEQHKPVIGFSCGDINGIGLELIVKAVSDTRLLDLCTPLIFASTKVINYFKKSVQTEGSFNFQSVKELNRITPRQVNVFNCWEEDIAVNPGQLTDLGGEYAIKSLTAAVTALKERRIHGLVTAPIHKKNTQSPGFDFTGHTPYLKHMFDAKDVLMLMAADNMRVGLVTEHVPLAEAAKQVTKAAILSKLTILKDSLIRDFGIDKPKIAVLGVNPHAGDDGLLGKEEQEIIKPAIAEFKQKNNVILIGPFSADAFFARGMHEKFDAVLAMYHDQGLIPFKSLAHGEGVNYTAGLPVVRTSPDHGTAFDIAGKNQADHASFVNAIFQCIEISRKRAIYAENNRNPLKKMSSALLARVEDEKIELE
ncbi:MAG: 4-hydroxythreonine-4-phosphate dehydrogenase PdxA [Chitinophagaceae bacterium]|nr:4-hydroxythreonine-4-phosphate dehydrogenase PdxA [Chitinophagaceae bacterium]